MTQPDDEWKIIEDKHKGVVYSMSKDKEGYKFCYVDKTLLDQIRREAVTERDSYWKHINKSQEYIIKKELLDELESQSSIFSGVGTPKLIIEKTKFYELKAKTRREK
jgi:hypothetical protein